jgi:ubiquinone/menaquinone biosynthesis C-methylase UbiE
MDLTRLGFASDFFDVILCSHVLEHIDDDRAALRELRRVLKPGGTVVLQHPIRDVQQTLEDPSITSPEERLHHYGQADHVRMYGRDFVDRLAEASFSSQVVTAEELLTPAEFVRYGLRDSTAPWIRPSDLYVCT